MAHFGGVFNGGMGAFAVAMLHEGMVGKGKSDDTVCRFLNDRGVWRQHSLVQLPRGCLESKTGTSGRDSYTTLRSNE